MHGLTFTNPSHQKGSNITTSNTSSEMGDEIKAECERIFKRFDANGDGKISLSELGDALKVLGSTSQEEVQRKMVEIDKDGDGFISFEELLAFQSANPDLMKAVAKKI